MFTVYRIVNKIDTRSYIGFTTLSPPERRFKRHKKSARLGHNTHLHRAIRKHGVDNFCFEILKQGEDHEWGLKVVEPYFVGMWKPEYNMTDGGEGILGLAHSEETRQKLRERATGKIPSVETRRRMSESQTGRKHSDETRKKMSLSQRGHVTSEETKEKIRITKRTKSCQKIKTHTS